MKTDKLTNLKNYKEIPPEVMNILTSGALNTGRYDISKNVYINVEEYTTKHIEDAKFESHEKYIDVQIILSGIEDIYYTNVNNNLTVSEPYSNDKDIAFYSNKVEKYDKVTLDGTNFVILYPQDAHAPQVAFNNIAQNVKKAVIKIRV